MEHPRLRDAGKLRAGEPFPTNEIPDDVTVRIGGHLVYLLHTGRKDISGPDWGDAFADVIGGTHLDSPVGIADVTLRGVAWSMKTVKTADPFKVRRVRIISGRCSPDYSYGITDPHKDIERTGRAVLGIWNERVNIAREDYRVVRTAVLVRSSDLLSYCLFEEETDRYRTGDYTWRENRNGNLEGVHKRTGEVRFTWQPHGSQFTVHTAVPESAVRFSVRRPPLLTKERVLEAIDFDPSWVRILR